MKDIRLVLFILLVQFCSCIAQEHEYDLDLDQICSKDNWYKVSRGFIQALVANTDEFDNRRELYQRIQNDSIFKEKLWKIEPYEYNVFNFDAAIADKYDAKRKQYLASLERFYPKNKVASSNPKNDNQHKIKTGNDFKEQISALEQEVGDLEKRYSDLAQQVNDKTAYNLMTKIGLILIGIILAELIVIILLFKKKKTVKISVPKQDYHKNKVSFIRGIINWFRKDNNTNTRTDTNTNTRTDTNTNTKTDTNTNTSTDNESSQLSNFNDELCNIRQEIDRLYNIIHDLEKKINQNDSYGGVVKQLQGFQENLSPKQNEGKTNDQRHTEGKECKIHRQERDRSHDKFLAQINHGSFGRVKDDDDGMSYYCMFNINGDEAEFEFCGNAGTALLKYTSVLDPVSDYDGNPYKATEIENVAPGRLQYDKSQYRYIVISKAKLKLY